MKVIGVDPAPVKNTVVFDGMEFFSFSPVELKNWLLQLEKSTEGILLCWDAPLTSFSKTYLEQSSKKNKISSESNFYARKLEHILRYKKNFNTPTGISTLPYGTCPHWAITQFCLGLPSLFENINCPPLPFELLTDDCVPEKGNHVLEVHPALAIWVWLSNTNFSVDNWEYKKNTTVFSDIKSGLKPIFQNTLAEKFIALESTYDNINSDDTLDAFIAWALGMIWMTEHSQARLIGNQDSGCIVLPKTQWSDELHAVLTNHG